MEEAAMRRRQAFAPAICAASAALKAAAGAASLEEAMVTMDRLYETEAAFADPRERALHSWGYLEGVAVALELSVPDLVEQLEPPGRGEG